MKLHITKSIGAASVAVIASLVLTPCLQARTLLSIDFEDLSEGTIAGQDGWTTTSASSDVYQTGDPDFGKILRSNFGGVGQSNFLDVGSMFRAGQQYDVRIVCQIVKTGTGANSGCGAVFTDSATSPATRFALAIGGPGASTNFRANYSTGTVIGDPAPVNSWVELRASVDFAHTDASGNYGLLTLTYRIVGDTAWVPTGIADLELGIADPAALTTLNLNIDGFSSKYGQTASAIVYEGADFDGPIDFYENFEGLALGTLAGQHGWTTGSASSDIYQTGDPQFGKILRSNFGPVGQSNYLTTGCLFEPGKKYHLRVVSQIVKTGGGANSGCGVTFADAFPSPASRLSIAVGGPGESTNFRAGNSGGDLIGDSAPVNTWLELKAEIDFAYTDAGGDFGIITMSYRELGDATWLSTGLSGTELGVDDPRLLTVMNLNIDGFSSKYGQTASVILFEDSDNDDLADKWERQYFMDLTTSDGTGDQDGEGRTDLQEFEDGTNPKESDTDGDNFSDAEEATYGTDPTDGSDLPSVGLVICPSVELNFFAYDGHDYEIQYSSNLEMWQKVPELEVINGTGQNVTRHVSTKGRPTGSEYYRVMEVIPN